MALLTSWWWLSLGILAASAGASDKPVGLGVGIGAALSPTQLKHTNPNDDVVYQRAGQSFAWGFFVDIPVDDYFYLCPAAQVYQFDLGQGVVPLTDVELQVKFLAPVSILHVGLGGVVGATAASSNYGFHLGAAGYVNVNVLANLDVFVQGKYERLFRPHGNLDVFQGYAGAIVLF